MDKTGKSNYDFMDNMQEFALIEEPDSTIKYANNAFCSFYGISSEEAKGTKLLDYVMQEDRVSCDMQLVVTPENPEYRVVGRTKKADGKIAWIQFVGRGYFDEDGKLIEFQEVGEEITEYKEIIESKVRKLERTNKKLSGVDREIENAFVDYTKDPNLGNIAVYTFDDIITRNKKMQNLIYQAKVIAQGNSAVFIEGESGTGKELMAQAIHNASKRANGPFVAINCGSISPELLQSELFGYVGGAFTGASKEGRKGKFEIAHMGTLFLDEIGEMPIEQQMALLRILETKKVIRMGGNENIPVDIRIICATNRDLYSMVMKGTFRGDLYFRLNVINIQMPPLRDRKDDIYLLAENFVEGFNKENKSDIQINETQYKLMYEYSWPGNIRELRNIVERILYMPGYELTSLKQFWEHNGKMAQQDGNNSDGATGEKEHIEKVIEKCAGNISRAAAEMGISRKTLYKRMDKYQITK